MNEQEDRLGARGSRRHVQNVLEKTRGVVAVTQAIRAFGEHGVDVGDRGVLFAFSAFARDGGGDRGGGDAQRGDLIRFERACVRAIVEADRAQSAPPTKTGTTAADFEPFASRGCGFE